MRFIRVVRVITVIGCALLCTAGCETTSPGGHISSAATPQEKAHQDQLSKMSSEDANNAGASTKRPDTRRQTVQDRDAGQRVIDQPMRR